MKVVLLCAGYATRLYPLTQNKPKPLLPVGEKPILEWILDRIVGLQDVEAVYLVTNHQFAGHFERWKASISHPWPLEVVDDQTLSNGTRLGAIGDLNYVLKKKKLGASDLLVIAGDNFFDFNLHKVVACGRTKRPHAVVAVHDVRDREVARLYGIVTVDAGGRVISFEEKPARPASTLASSGIYWLPAEAVVLLDRYLTGGHNPDQPGHFMKWLAEADRLFAIPLEGCWLDIGDKSSYKKANTMFRQFQKSSSKENL